jgi:hypothetical protein
MTKENVPFQLCCFAQISVMLLGQLSCEKYAAVKNQPTPGGALT